MTLLTDALRSNKYLQAVSQLNIDDRGFCCLGVACEVAMQNGLDLHKSRFGLLNADDIEEKIADDELESLSGNVYVYDGWLYFLPPRVREWFGFKDDRGKFLNAPYPVTSIEVSLHAAEDLAQLNDLGTPFAKVADVIDELWINPLKEIA